MSEKPRYNHHFSMLNAYNVIMGNNTLKEIKESEYPYFIKGLTTGDTLDEFICMVIAYFETIECYEMCLELKGVLKEWRAETAKRCHCKHPIYKRLFKVRKPLCVHCNKQIFP